MDRQYVIPANLPPGLSPYIPQLNTYIDLGLKEFILDEDEASFIENLLIDAETNADLSSVLHEIDKFICLQQSLIHEDNIQNYRDQRAWLIEYLGNECAYLEPEYQRAFQERIEPECKNIPQPILTGSKIGDFPIDNIHDERGQMDPHFKRMVQKKLTEAQVYDGPIDGVHGEHTREAVKKFQKRKGITPSNGNLESKTIEKLCGWLS